MTIGLFVFVAVTALNLAGLVVDLYLELESLTTITDLARAHDWFGTAILLLQVLAIIGLACHFYGVKS